LAAAAECGDPSTPQVTKVKKVRRADWTVFMVKEYVLKRGVRFQTRACQSMGTEKYLAGEEFWIISLILV